MSTNKIYSPSNVDLTGFNLKSDAKPITEGVHKGRTYKVCTKTVQHGFFWKVWNGLAACLLTATTFGSASYTKKSAKLWQQAKTGQEIIKVRVWNFGKNESPALIKLKEPIKPFNFDSMHYDRAASSGKGPVGQAEKAAILWKHHEDVLNDQDNEQDREKGLLRDVEMLTSRYADREMEIGAIVHLKDGEYFVDRQFAEKGALVSVLKGREGQAPKIVCRGTATRRSATEGYASALNDVSIQIGQLGVQSIWPDLKSYLQENKIQKVEVLGKSLGGGQAQALAVLLEGQGIVVEHLITFASVGVGKEVNHIFLNEILEKRQKPFKMTVVRNGGSHAEIEVDYIPFIGGVHLGAGASAEKMQANVYYLALENQEIETCKQELPLHQLALKFLGSFKKAHTRQNTLVKFHWKKIEEKPEVQEHLQMGEGLEKYRAIFAKMLSYVLPNSLQHQPFSSYFKNGITAMPS